MLPWKRKEVFTGFSERDFYKVQNILNENKIHYDTRVVDPGRTKGILTDSRTITPFLNQEFVRQYYVYVAPVDYERVKYLLSQLPPAKTSE